MFDSRVCEAGTPMLGQRKARPHKSKKKPPVFTGGLPGEVYCYFCCC
jgi:hypothetical protein